MDAPSKPLVQLELSGGSLQIQTDRVVYRISVNPDAPSATVAAGSPAALPEPAPAPTPPKVTDQQVDPTLGDGDGGLFKKLTEELYNEVGALARKLSISLADLKVDPGDVDLAGSGHALENAKDQLSDIMLMTERATMNIMDLTDSIQDDVVKAQQYINTLVTAEYVDDSEHEDFINQVKILADSHTTIKPLIAESQQYDNEMLALLGEVLESLGAPPSSAPIPVAPAAPQTKIETENRIVFPLNDLFQILYELCANDDVKKHIKAIWTKIDEFDAKIVNEALAAGAESFEKDEEFVMVPLEPLFSALLQATDNASFKDIITKLNAAAAQLFLDQSLPVEVAYEEVQIKVEVEPVASVEPEATDPGPVGDTLADRVAVMRDKLTLHTNSIKEQTAKVLDIQLDKERLNKFSNSFLVYGKERIAFTDALTTSKDLVARIMTSLTAIIENLSFQDLAGQRIQKILTTLSFIQIDLLKILVSFSHKIKADVKDEAAVKDMGQIKEMAQKDVDSMLDRFGLGPMDEEVDLVAGETSVSRLDQDSVDDLLGELGF